LKHIIPLILTLSLLGCQTLPADITFPAPTASHASVPTAAPPSAEQALRADVIAQIQADPMYQQPYLQALEAVSGTSIPETCADFAVRLSAFEANLTAQQFRVSADGICYVTTADGTIIVDAENKDGFLYLSPAIASQALGVEVVRVSADGRYGSIGDAYNAKDERVGGVSRFTMQWEKVNADGVLPSEADPSSAPPTPVNPEQSNLYRVNYAPAIDEEAQAQAIQALVGDYMSGKLKEVSGLNKEQLRAFRAAYVEAKNEARTPELVTYTYINGEEFFINPQTLKGEKLPANPSADFIKENTITMYYEVDEDANGNLMIKDLEGNWHTIKGSAGIKWDKVITDHTDPDMPKVLTEKTDNNFGQLSGLTFPEYFLASKEREVSSAMTRIIVLDKKTGEIIMKSGPAFRKIPIIPIFIPETDGDGTVLAVNIAFLARIQGLTIYEEGTSKEVSTYSDIREGFPWWNSLETDMVFWLGAPINQNASIEKDMFLSIDNTSGVSLESPKKIGGKNNSEIKIIFGHTLIEPAK
jgi:hypothetical protein